MTEYVPRQNYLPVLWGKLASEILVQNWDGALDDLTKLREFIDNGAGGATTNNMQVCDKRRARCHYCLLGRESRAAVARSSAQHSRLFVAAARLGTGTGRGRQQAKTDCLSLAIASMPIMYATPLAFSLSLRQKVLYSGLYI